MTNKPDDALLAATLTRIADAFVDGYLATCEKAPDDVRGTKLRAGLTKLVGMVSAATLDALSDATTTPDATKG